MARRLGTQSVRRGSNPGGACRSVSVSLDIGGSFVLSVDWDCMSCAGRNNENEVHLEKPLCNIEFKDYIIESPPDATTTFRERTHLFITSKISSDHEDPCLVSYYFKLIFWSD